jgi:hypothetical protein
MDAGPLAPNSKLFGANALVASRGEAMMPWPRLVWLTGVHERRVAIALAVGARSGFR